MVKKKKADTYVANKRLAFNELNVVVEPGEDLPAEVSQEKIDALLDSEKISRKEVEPNGSDNDYQADADGAGPEHNVDVSTEY